MVINFFSKKISIQDSALIVSIALLFVMAIFSFTLSKNYFNYATGALANVIPTSGLIAYYPFDNDFNDYSGNGRNGISHGATLGSGLKGNASSFIDPNYIDLSTTGSSFSGTTPFTISAWVKTSANQDQIIIQQRDYRDWNGEYMLSVKVGGKVNFFETGDQQNGYNITSDISVVDGKWHHIAAKRDQYGGYLYVDGVVTRSLIPPKNLNPQLGVAIGRDIRDNNNSFVGSIDEVRIYGRALTDNEIGSLLNYNNQACVDNDKDGYGALGSLSCSNGSQLDCNNYNSNINPGINISTDIECDGVDHNCDGNVTCSACVVKSAPEIFYQMGVDPHAICQQYHPGGYAYWTYDDEHRFDKLEWIFTWNVAKMPDSYIYNAFTFSFEYGGGYLGPTVTTGPDGVVKQNSVGFTVWSTADTTQPTGTQTVSTTHPYNSPQCHTEIEQLEGTNTACGWNNELPTTDPRYKVNVWKSGVRYKLTLQKDLELSDGVVWKATLTDLSTLQELVIGRIKLDDLKIHPGTKGYGKLVNTSTFAEYLTNNRCLVQERSTFIKEGPMGDGKWIPKKAVRAYHACYKSKATSPRIGVLIDEAGKGVSREVNLNGYNGDWWENATIWDVGRDQVCNMNGKCENLGGDQETASSCPSDCASIQTGTISATSNPVGANVYVDNVLKGTTSSTPLLIAGVTPGTHVVKFVKTGYSDNTRSVTVTTGQTSTVSAPLVQLSGDISVISTPTGSQVYVGNVLKGTTGGTPLLIVGVTPGTHLVKFTKTGYSDVARTVTIIGGQTTTVSVTLIQLLGTISATSTPVGADVYVDNVLKGKTSATALSILGVTPGTRSVKFTKSGYSDVTRSVTITSGQTLPVSTELALLTGSIYATSNPVGANVYVDNILKGITSAATSLMITGITPGIHSVKFTKSEYLDVVRSVTVIANQTSTFMVTLIR